MQFTVTIVDPVMPPPGPDGGYLQPPCMPAPVRSGICERVPGIDPQPIDVTSVDAGSAFTGP